MKLNKTLALAALVAGSLFAGSTLQAQDSTNTPSAGAPAVRNRPDFAKELNLTEDQKPKFQEIMKGAQQKRQALRADTSLSAEDKKAKAKAIQEDTTKQMKALLTEEQFTKWQKMAQGMRQRMQPAAPAGGDSAPKKD
jgi:hypothetical protein